MPASSGRSTSTPTCLAGEQVCTWLSRWCGNSSCGFGSSSCNLCCRLDHSMQGFRTVLCRAPAAYHVPRCIRTSHPAQRSLPPLCSLQGEGQEAGGAGRGAGDVGPAAAALALAALGGVEGLHAHPPQAPRQPRHLEPAAGVCAGARRAGRVPCWYLQLLGQRQPCRQVGWLGDCAPWAGAKPSHQPATSWPTHPASTTACPPPAQTTAPDFSNYDDSGAWPYLIDEVRTCDCWAVAGMECKLASVGVTVLGCVLSVVFCWRLGAVTRALMAVWAS